MESYSVSVPLTTKDKIVNFWFYNKLKVLFVLFALIILAFGIKSCIVNKKADFSAMIIVNGYANASQIDQMKTHMLPFVNDINGDKKTTIDIVQISFSNEDNQIDYAARQKLVVELFSAKSYLFICDKQEYEKLKAQNALSDLSNLGIKTTDDNLAVVIDTTKIVSNETLTLPPELYLSVRIHEGVEDKSKLLLAEKAIEIIKRLSS